MRSDQRRRYAERIDRATRLLEREATAGRAPDAAALAAAAALSEHHFQRVYRLMTGETVGQTVRRVRLAASVPELRRGGTVTDAAGAAGYATPQAYARALRAETGTSATQVLRDEAVGRLGTDLARSAASATTPLSVEVVSLEPFTVAAIRNIGDYAELDRGYGRLFALVLADSGPEAILGIYGVPLDDPRFVPAHECRFDCALHIVQDAATPAGTSPLRLGGGQHARLRHLGSYDDMPASIDALYEAVLDAGGYEPADAPTFIHYLDDPEEVPEVELRSDILLPLR